MVMTSSYAWLTYVQKKSLVALDTHEISITLEANDIEVINLIAFDDLAFIDYQRDFVNDEFDTLDLMSSSWMIKIQMSTTSPLSKHFVSLEGSQAGLIYLLVYEGINDDITPKVEAYADLIATIIDGYLTKEDQLQAIALYNQNVLDEIYNHVFGPNDFVKFQIVAWGDYDALEVQSTYLNASFDLTLFIESVNSKGEVTS